MHRIIFRKEAGSENYLRNLALELIISAEGAEHAIKIAKLTAYSSGFTQEETQELTSWGFTFSLIICMASLP